MMGAALGAELGKTFDGKRLLVLFGLLMIGVGLSMLRPRRTAEAPDVRLTRDSATTLLPRLVPMGLGVGLGVGLAAGFCGIGGTITGVALGKTLGTRQGLLERGFAAVVSRSVDT